MPTENSVVIIETADRQIADITLIVHGEDVATLQRLHALCREAISQAVQHIDSPGAARAATSRE